MKDELYAELFGHGVKYIEVDENATSNGLPSALVKVFATDRDEAHNFVFSRNDTVDFMATAIKGMLRNRT